MKKTSVRKSFRKAKVNYPWLPPIRLQKPHDFLILSQCNAGMFRALEEIRMALSLIESGVISRMRLMHVPGSGGETEKQIALYCRFKGWVQMMDEADLKKQRRATEGYAKGENLREIERSVRIRNGHAKVHIVKGLEEYQKMFDSGDRNRA